MKSTIEYNIGDRVDFELDRKSSILIGIVGIGSMGLQIAEYFLSYGFNVHLKTRNSDKIVSIYERIQKNLSKKYTSDDVRKILDRCQITTEYLDLKGCDLIIDASSEDFDIKESIFREISEIKKENAIIATNSSSISIDKLAAVTKMPEKCIGMHFFNPVRKMSLIEVIIGEKTSNDVIDTIFAVAKSIDKEPIVIRNSPGFVVNRLLLPQINEAIRLLEQNVANKESIDSAVKLGLNHPMGPFELADYIGLDICISILNELHIELESEFYKPANLLKTLVGEGKLGIKTGEGFYNYK